VLYHAASNLPITVLITPLGSQMAQLMMAQRAYQANLSVVDRARESYNAAIQLGRA